MSVRRNEDKGSCVVRVHYTADPAKCDERWIAAARKGFPSLADWRREMEIDRTRGGRAYYPPFAENPRRFVRKAPGFMRAVPIVRGWDFGGEHPAAVWGQYGRRERRFWCLRELLGISIDTFAFRDLVKYLSGQIPLAELERWPRALEMLEELESDSRYPPHPWFDGAYRFVDFTGHEGVMGTRGLTTGGEKRTATEILYEGGIYLLSHYVLIDTRRQILMGLANVRADGYPGFLIDPACLILVEGLCGEIKFAKPTPQNPDPAKPQEDNYYSHPHDALGYAVTNSVTVEEADWLPQSKTGAPYVEPQWGDNSLETYLSEGRG
jgi:hypothetical protein